MGKPDVTDTHLPSEFQQKTEDYIYGRLGTQEEEEFWTEVIKDGDKMDYLHMCLLVYAYKNTGGEE